MLYQLTFNILLENHSTCWSVHAFFFLFFLTQNNISKKANHITTPAFFIIKETTHFLYLFNKMLRLWGAYKLPYKCLWMRCYHRNDSINEHINVYFWMTPGTAVSAASDQSDMRIQQHCSITARSRNLSLSHYHYMFSSHIPAGSLNTDLLLSNPELVCLYLMPTRFIHSSWVNALSWSGIWEWDENTHIHSHLGAI